MVAARAAGLAASTSPPSKNPPGTACSSRKSSCTASEFDLETEVDLFAAQLSAQLRAARQHKVIIADKTIANVMAYAWLVLQTPPGPPASPSSASPRTHRPPHELTACEGLDAWRDD